MENQTKLEQLTRRIAELERIEQKHKDTEAELKVVNRQLDASIQQLKATEQQLQAYNEQLQQSEKKLIRQKEEAQIAKEFAENILDTVRQPLLVLNHELLVVSANRYFYQTFQVSETKTKGRFLYELGNNQWEIPQLNELLKKTLPGKSTVEDFEVEHNFETIGRKIMLLNARELKQKKGKERLILLAIEDVTARKNAESKLLKLNTELEKKAAELQQILYITTHDLRSPLVNIQGFTKEMQASISDLQDILDQIIFKEEVKSDLKLIMEEEIPEAIYFITSSITKMDKLLNGLLVLSRLGRQKLHFQKLDMNRLMEQVLDDYKFEIDRNNVKIEQADLPSCTGDELQINQLFSNLVGNAIKFLDLDKRGKIKINGIKKRRGTLYSIEDNGIGISEKYTQKVFGLFEKLNPEKPGIGLGLNIVKQIVDKHNGTIELESKLDRGTKFIIFIPD